VIVIISFPSSSVPVIVFYKPIALIYSVLAAISGTKSHPKGFPSNAGSSSQSLPAY
jgi:hypothetical protein